MKKESVTTIKPEAKKVCDDCGKESVKLLNNKDVEHGDFWQCPECYKAYQDSFGESSINLLGNVEEDKEPEVKPAVPEKEKPVLKPELLAVDTVKTGMFGKYLISKTDGSPVDQDAVYFVLRLDTDKAARQAARKYAVKCGDEQLGETLHNICRKYAGFDNG